MSSASNSADGAEHLLRELTYIGAFALYLRLALRSLVAETGDGARMLPTVEALVKAIFLDMSTAGKAGTAASAVTTNTFSPFISPPSRLV